MHSKNYKYHLITLGIFLIYYFLNILTFKSLTTLGHDNLDGLVVYNKIIGDIYSGKILNSDIFLGGELPYFYLRHFYKPFVLIYALLNPEIAYFFTDFLVKLIAYISFFIFAKKINKNFLINSLCAALFAFAIPFKTLGFGNAIMPYLIYLIIYRNKIEFKHYLIVIFFGLNTDLVAELFLIPFMIIIIFFINKNLLQKNLKSIIILLSLFFSCSLLTSLNLLYVILFEPETHRIEQIIHPLPINQHFINLISDFLKIPKKFSGSTIQVLPLSILILPTLLISIFSKNKIVKKFFILIISIFFLNIFLNTAFFNELRDNNTILKIYKWLWINYYLNTLFVILIFYLLKSENYLKFKLLSSLVFISLLLYQINSMIIPVMKKFILKEHNYRNIYTFNGYYMYEDYKLIKKIVENKRVISIGFYPLIAVMNNIFVIDGYHALYPLRYKKKFRKIISEELEQNNRLKTYYDKWGNRVYAFYSDPNNIKLNFLEAKNLGAEYVISRNRINNINLEIIPLSFKNDIFFYKIN